MISERQMRPVQHDRGGVIWCGFCRTARHSCRSDVAMGHGRRPSSKDGVVGRAIAAVDQCACTEHHTPSFAMLYPQMVVRLNVAAAGWYCMPDARAIHPYGLAAGFPFGPIGRWG